MEPPGIYRCPSTPGSAGAIAAMRACVWHCWVAELRFCGVYLPAPLIASRRIAEGYLASKDEGVSIWSCHLFREVPKDFNAPPRLNPLMKVKKVSYSEDITYLIHGEAWDDGCLQRWPQAWLCAGSEERLQASLDRAADWLLQRYRGVYKTRA